METRNWTINLAVSTSDDLKKIEEAAALLRKGELVAFPTETVYGLGADATNEEAVRKIFEAKGRPQDNPLIVHVRDKEQLSTYVTEVPEYVEKLLSVYSPGPLTYILNANDRVAKNVTAGLSTVAIRIPDHPVANALIEASGLPLAAPSANLSGKPSPTSAQHVREDLTGRIAGIVDSGQVGVGIESTVIDCTGAYPVVLRPGGITEEMLQEVVGQIETDPALHNQSARPKSPGMKYRHYAPEVPLWLVSGDTKRIQSVIDQARKEYKQIALLGTDEMLQNVKADQVFSFGSGIEDVAHHMYDGLRTFKSGEVDLIVCQAFAETGLGQAVMNRLKKAATQYLEK